MKKKNNNYCLFVSYISEMIYCTSALKLPLKNIIFPFKNNKIAITMKSVCCLFVNQERNQNCKEHNIYFILNSNIPIDQYSEGFLR